MKSSRIQQLIQNVFGGMDLPYPSYLPTLPTSGTYIYLYVPISIYIKFHVPYYRYTTFFLLYQVSTSLR